MKIRRALTRIMALVLVVSLIFCFSSCVLIKQTLCNKITSITDKEENLDHDTPVLVEYIMCDSIIFHGDNSKVLYPTKYAGIHGNIPVFEFNFIPADENKPDSLDNLWTNPNVIQINYEILPHIADAQDVEFEYNEDSGVAVYHELSGSFVFLKPDVALTITIRAIDGSNISTQIRIKGRTVSAEN